MILFVSIKVQKNEPSKRQAKVHNFCNVATELQNNFMINQKKNGILTANRIFLVILHG